MPFDLREPSGIGHQPVVFDARIVDPLRQNIDQVPYLVDEDGDQQDQQNGQQRERADQRQRNAHAARQANALEHANRDLQHNRHNRGEENQQKDVSQMPDAQ